MGRTVIHLQCTGTKVPTQLGVRKLACSMQLMIISVFLELQTALANLCLMVLACLPQALALSQKSLPAHAAQTFPMCEALCYIRPHCDRRLNLLQRHGTQAAQNTAAQHRELHGLKCCCAQGMCPTTADLSSTLEHQHLMSICWNHNPFLATSACIHVCLTDGACAC